MRGGAAPGASRSPTASLAHPPARADVTTLRGFCLPEGRPLGPDVPAPATTAGLLARLWFPPSHAWTAGAERQAVSGRKSGVNPVLPCGSIPPNLTPSEKLRRLTNTFNKNISRGYGCGSHEKPYEFHSRRPTESTRPSGAAFRVLLLGLVRASREGALSSRPFCSPQLVARTKDYLR